ncbi:DUF3131 domain-containing protein [Yoonia sp.]|nr:DUF3131 domain-containing protein [Yoonia sp.]
MSTQSALPLSRRALLALAAACVPVASSRTLFAQGSEGSLLTLVFEDLSGPNSYDVIRAFLERSLPIAAILELAPDAATPLPQEFIQYAGLFEILAPAPDVANLPRFAQARGAAEQRAKLDVLVPAAISSVGVINRTGQSGLAFAAFRSAGFQVFVNIDGTNGVDATPVGRGQIDIRAGHEIDTSPTALSLVDQVTTLLASGGAHVAIISLAPLKDAVSTKFATQLSNLIADLEAKTRDGLLVMMRPMDHLLLTGSHLARPTAVLLDVTPQTQSAAIAMIARADASGIPITVAGDVDVLNRLGRPDDCQALHSHDASMTATPPLAGDALLARCVLVDHRYVNKHLGASEIVLQRGAASISHSRISADGRLHAAVAPWTMLFSDTPVFADPVVLIAPSDYATAQQRETILQILSAKAQSGKSLLLKVADWADHLTAPDKLYQRFLSAHRRNFTDPNPSEKAPLSQAERAAFMVDAQAAWAFIADHTIAETGLSLSTVQGGMGRALRDQFVNSEITLWDLGSQIQGILAAYDIGLIPLQERNERIAKLIAHIPVITMDGARLPPAIFSVTTLRPIRRDFDVCDLGRFLLALDNAIANGALTEEAATKLIAGWDIQAAVRGGRLHSYRAGKWVDITLSHCTDYISPAFIRRGFAVENLFPPITEPLDVDEEMAILALAAFAGAIGTEPPLLELVEGKGTQVATLLADMLFDAQLGWYETEGKFRSMSETPINRAPWFLYQGLFLERSGDAAWAVNSIDPAPQYTTEAFRAETEVIVSKSAYLWYAARPHAYSLALVDLIRDNCRIDGEGFSVGIFAATGEPMQRYFDINTNGIILSALRRILT